MKILKILSLIIIISFISCNTKTNYYPKPKSYIRIDFPEKKYYLVNDFCPFSFEIPEYSAWSKSFRKKDDCSKTIIFPNFKAEILCDYLILENNLSELSESFRKMVYEHSFKSSAIIERVWVNESTNVYVIAYEIKGNTALNYAFTVTDSSKNFFSGQLLFQTSPNYDSLKPSIEFIKNDIEALIASFQWRD